MRETEYYKSENGYSGALYGESTMSIYDRTGREVLHTGFRDINTEEELIEFVEHFPEFQKIMFGETRNETDNYNSKR
jgi:hypothetical protein